MKRLIVFGDSFSSTNYCVDVDCSFYGRLGKELGVDLIVNYSWPGNDLTTIKHLVVNEIDQFDPENDYVVVGIPPIERVTLYDSDNADIRSFSRMLIDSSWQVKNEKISFLQGTMSGPIHDLVPGYIAVYDRSWHEAMTLTDVNLLHGFLDSKKFRHIIVNLTQPFDSETQWNTLTNLIRLTKQHPNNIIFDKTYYSVNYQKHIPVDYDRYGWFGHHGADGNQRWYEEAINPLVKSLGWV